MPRKHLFGFVAALAGATLFLVLVGTRAAGIPPLGVLLDPADGLYRTARLSRHPSAATVRIEALEAPVTVVRDERGVPHVFAASDRDAIIALGYVVAQDRLFQMDFIPRVAAGRLAEALGPAAVPADRFLRSTGMEWGARRNLARIEAEGGRELDLLNWFAVGANAWIDGLGEEDLPLEFRLLGYRPDRYSALHGLRVLQYMTYDLTYRTDDAAYALLKDRLDPADYARLYPRFSSLFVPIVPASSGERAVSGRDGQGAAANLAAARRALVAHAARAGSLQGTPAEGFLHGKGSNNWAVTGERSTTGAPILAGDMHLSLTLPAVWYEVHLVTPSMNTYGVTVPGAPLPVEGFTPYTAWAFTNTGADQIDHYALELDATQTRYRAGDEWRDLDVVVDTIHVNGAAAVVDTLRYSHLGPVLMQGGGAVALRWVAHEASRTMDALWGMNHARDHAAFQQALRAWDAPMQNILYAGSDGIVSIRSTGHLPVRRTGTGAGLLDGTTGEAAWIGRVPFDELPYAVDPAQGFLTSTNQQPTDSTYGYYLGYDWRDGYRSLRIQALLEAKSRHSADDLKAYQADVHAVQHDLFAPLLDTLGGLEPAADRIRRMLTAWDGETTVDRSEPLVLETFLSTLRRLAWDEPAFRPETTRVDGDGEPVTVGVPLPNETRLYELLATEPSSKWLDIRDTPVREDASGLLRHALAAAAATLEAHYGADPAGWRWGAHHHVVFRHMVQSDALRPLWRGPFEYPGFRATLSPAAGRPTTHSASWRMVVDFSQAPPRAVGVYPGGQSGSPFSSHYDRHLPVFLNFQYYPLHAPASPDALGDEAETARLALLPGKAGGDVP